MPAEAGKFFYLKLNEAAAENFKMDNLSGWGRSRTGWPAEVEEEQRRWQRGEEKEEEVGKKHRKERKN